MLNFGTKLLNIDNNLYICKTKTKNTNGYKI